MISKEENNWIDHTAQKAVKHLEKVRISSIDKSQAWKKICKKLDQIDRKFLTWFSISTASCTMLLAAGLSMIDHHLYPDQMKIIDHQASLDELQQESTPNETIEVILAQEENIRPVKNKNQSIKAALVPELGFQINQMNKNLVLSPTQKEVRLNTPNFRFNGSVYLSEQGINPSLGLDIKLFEFNNEANAKRFYIGTSHQWVKNTPRSETYDYHDHTILNFIDIKYEALNRYDKGWNMSAGLLVNTNNNTYLNGGTAKVSFIRKLNKHIGVGPEVYLTNGFNQIYGGLSLKISS